jgi:hypothetical protein
MKARLVKLAYACVALAALGACGEKPQVLQSSKNDVPAYQGTGDGFTAAGWKPGDKTSWEQGLKTRMQNSQNEYTRLSVAK